MESSNFDEALELNNDEADDDSKESGVKDDDKEPDNKKSAPEKSATGSKKDDKMPAKSKGPRTVSDLTADGISAYVTSQGWSLIGEPKVNEVKNSTATTTTTMLTIIKPPRGGSIALYSTDSELVAKSFEKGLKDSGAVKREGNNVIAVIIPNHKDIADQLLKELLQ